MESVGEAKVFSHDQAALPLQRKHLFGNSWMAMQESGIFVHAPNCNAASGCTCSFAQLNCGEMTALVGAVQNGIADRAEERVRI